MTLLSRVKNITPDNTSPLNVAYYWKQAKWLRDFVDMKLFCHHFKRVLESNVRLWVRFVSRLLTPSLMSHLLNCKVNSWHTVAVCRELSAWGVVPSILPIVPPHTDKHKHAHLGGCRPQYELHFVPAIFPAASLSETNLQSWPSFVSDHVSHIYIFFGLFVLITSLLFVTCYVPSTFLLQLLGAHICMEGHKEPSQQTPLWLFCDKAVSAWNQCKVKIKKKKSAVIPLS